VRCHGCSLPLQRRIADFGSERSGRCSVVAFEEHYGIELPLYTVEAVTRRVAKDCAEFNIDQPPEPDAASKVQVTELDGSMVPIVEFAPPQEAASPEARDDKRKRRRCLWKEVRVCTTHDIDRARARYGACFGSAFETGCMMSLTVRQNGLAEHTRIHGIADGAPWIAEQFEKQFGLQHNFLIDFYHLCEYLGQAAASCVGKDEPEWRRHWMNRQKERLKANRYRDVVAELEPHLEAEHTPNESAPVRRCWRYLTNRSNHLDYRSAIAQQLPIGSGEVESAHRHLVQRRLKLPGAWWLRENAANVIQMRVTRANQQWDQFWNQKAAA
jgi:hypothetical protein